MNKNIYVNFAITALIIVAIGFACMMISAIDRIVSRTEKVSEQLTDMKRELKELKRDIARHQITGVASQGKHSGNQTPSSVPAVGKIANLEFYNKNAQSGGRMIFAVSADTKNMNNMVNNDATVSTLWGYANESLAALNYKNLEEHQPELAESWEISADKMTYTVKLKKGVLWHDFKDPVTGKEWKNVEVTAHDFKFYVDVIKNTDTDCAPLRVYFKDLDKIEVVNDHEFKICWKKKYFKSVEITLGLSPLPRHLYHAYDGPFNGKKFNDDHQRNRLIVGCGPYRFVKWDKGQKLIMKRFEKYYGRNYGVMPALEHLVFEVINHPHTRFQALLSKKLDSLGLTPDQWVHKTATSEFGDKGFLGKYKYPKRAYYYLGYNQKNPLFKDKRVRQAFAHLIDRKRILKDVYYGLGRIITGPFFVDSVYYDKNVQPYEFSVKKASQLLKEAGWSDTDGDGILDKDGKNFEFSILQVSNSSIQQKMLPIIKEGMAKGGIVMKIQSVEWSVLLERLENRNFDACTLGWTAALSPDPYQLWHSSQADVKSSSNHIGFKNKKADKLIEEIRVTFDLKKRTELCHKFHRLLHDLQPYTFLFSPDNLRVLNKRYKNVRVFPLGVPERIMWVPDAQQQAIAE